LHPTNMRNPTILIAGIGNIFLGDDAFGSEVARRLELQSWPDGVRVVDFGIRGLDFAYALLDGYDLVVIVDAAPRGTPPGTLSVVEPDLSVLDSSEQSPTLLDAHTLDPLKILGLARVMGARWARLLLVACEPADLGGEEGRLGMSDPVRIAVDEAARMIVRLVNNVRSVGLSQCDGNIGITTSLPHGEVENTAVEERI
jgi:hydrogenase maturation protease